MNIINSKDGSTSWKKWYKARKSSELVLNEDGLSVFYRNKMILINPETGKSVWKKPIKFEDIEEEGEGEIIKRKLDRGMLVTSPGKIGLYNETTGKKIWSLKLSSDSRTAFDAVNNRLAIIDGKKFYLFDPCLVEKKPEKLKLDIEEPDEIVGFESKEDGYFITGINEYFFIGKDGVVKEHQYYKQLKTDRLLRAAMTTALLAGDIMSTEVTVTDAKTDEVLYQGGLFMTTENARAVGEVSRGVYESREKLKEDSKLNNAVKSSNEYAYFLKGEKGSDGDIISMVKIEKESGKSLETFDFGTDRNIIFEMDKTNNMLYRINGDKLDA